jgi:hypothetical protein
VNFCRHGLIVITGLVVQPGHDKVEAVLVTAPIDVSSLTRHMNQMEPLKLVALDAEDLTVISAHMQDAVLKAGDITFWKSDSRFALLARRFDWEGADSGQKRRRLSALQFGRVLSVQAQGIDAALKERVLSLLSVTFTSTSPALDEPGGEILLIFSEDAAIRLGVECVEAQLTDLGPIWEAAAAPEHPAG